MVMSKTLIDVDEDLLTRSQQILGTTTKKDTINGALREVVRRAAAEAFLTRARSGVFGVPARHDPRSPT
jgi:Arc/MetJ family transcription regulator